MEQNPEMEQYLFTNNGTTPVVFFFVCFFQEPFVQGMVGFDILRQQLLPLSSMPLALNVHVRDAERVVLSMRDIYFVHCAEVHVTHDCS